MKLFEIITNFMGESYVRSYVWCETESQASEMFLSQNKQYTIKEIVLLFDSSSAPFVTDPDDSGFGKIRLAAAPMADTRKETE